LAAKEFVGIIDVDSFCKTWGAEAVGCGLPSDSSPPPPLDVPSVIVEAAPPPVSDDLSQEQFNEAVSLLDKIHTMERQDKLKTVYWRTLAENHGDFRLGGPYLWQEQFHAAGLYAKERGLIAANRVGKTQCASAEVAMHLTGIYPPWWKGKRFTTAIRAWVGSDTNETSRDIVQLSLLGEEALAGFLLTGSCPRRTANAAFQVSWTP